MRWLVRSAKLGRLNFPVVAAFLMLILSGCLLLRYGQLPVAPVLGDEVIINDASASFANGQGYAATSFTDSRFGIDRLFAHYPPVYPLAESLAIRLLGFSVYSLRLVSTIMALATALVFLFLLARLQQEKLLSFSAACFVAVVYCTATPLLIMQRMARMESTIAFFAVCATGWILNSALTKNETRAKWSLLLAGIFIGLGLATHPEAATALVLLAPLFLWALPGRWMLKTVGALLTVVVPCVLWGLTFRTQSTVALKQFLSILHSATPVDPDIPGWLRQVCARTDLATLNRNVAFIELFVAVLVMVGAYFLVVRNLEKSQLRRRLASLFALGAVLELFVMQWLLRMDVRRYQFLFAPLLIGIAIALFGEQKAARPWIWAACGLGVLQLGVMAFYLSPRKDRVAGMNPDRYESVVRAIPAGISVAAEADLWLDFRTAGRPLTLIYPIHDGRGYWQSHYANLFDPFDAVILVNSPGDAEEPRLLRLAQAGRAEYDYPAGDGLVRVFMRNGIHPLYVQSAKR